MKIYKSAKPKTVWTIADLLNFYDAPDKAAA